MLEFGGICSPIIPTNDILKEEENEKSKLLKTARANSLTLLWVIFFVSLFDLELGKEIMLLGKPEKWI